MRTVLASNPPASRLPLHGEKLKMIDEESKRLHLYAGNTRCARNFMGERAQLQVQLLATDKNKRQRKSHYMS
jgi:hypothetical protein